MSIGKNDCGMRRQEALGNHLILRRIFQHLPTGFLLSSCSLVNKSWNNEARTFIRDYRKCTVGITGKTDEFLKHLDQFCGQIADNGRIVPFNSFKSNNGYLCRLDSNYEEFTTPNLRSQIKLFHLDIDCRSSLTQCHVHKPLSDLLQHKINQLQSLKIEFTLTQPGDDDAKFFNKIIEAKPQLKMLCISVLKSSSILFPADIDHPAHQEPGLHTTLEKFLQVFHQSLRTISIVGPYQGFGRLSHPPLVNLSKFRMDRSGELEDRSLLYKNISTIVFANKMPRLGAVEFVAPMIRRDPDSNWAPTKNSCTTVRNLELTYSSPGDPLLHFFRNIFPNVSSLKIICGTGIPPLRKICALFRRLEELDISAERSTLRDSFDSDFCGIHPEEVKLLREKDEEYLKTVNIVPTAYSILSMKSLRTLRMDLKFGEYRSAVTAGLNFITKVTDLIAFRMVPEVDISVIWSLTRDANPREEEKYCIIRPAETIWSRRKVLENPSLLHKIVAHLPTSLLLSSCSLVNKTWNTEARKFIVENRECTATITFANNACELVGKFDQLCCRISKEGRIIPWSRVKVHVSCCHGAYSELPTLKSDEMITLKSMYRPNYLELNWNLRDWEADCLTHRPLEALLRQCAGELRVFRVGNLPPRLAHVLSGCASQFPKLEEIIISNLPDSYLRSDKRLTLNHIVTSIVQRAANVQKIVSKDVESLEVVPEDLYRLLDTLKFYFREIEDERLYLRVAQGSHSLRKLRIFQPFPVPVNEYAPVSSFREAFNKSLERLLQACHQTLEILSIESVYSLCQLSFPPLRNLRQLKLKTKFGPLQDFSQALISIDNGNSMPMLEEVEIKMANLVEMDSTSREFVDGDVAWPFFDENRDGVDMLCCSNSVRKLTLGLHVKKINFSLLTSLFPKVTSLEIRGQKRIRMKRDPLPFSEMFRFWPDLKELRIFGAKHFPNRDYDSDLCGIHEEEAEVLRTMNPNFLQIVHIVPVKSSLLSMTNLQKLWIESGFGDDMEADESDRSQSFVFTVAELIAFRRMARLKVIIE